MSVTEGLTPVQWAAVQATATRHLRDSEELGRELLPLLFIDPMEEQDRPAATTDSTVNDDLTPTTELPVIRPESYAITFHATGAPL